MFLSFSFNQVPGRVVDSPLDKELAVVEGSMKKGPWLVSALPLSSWLSYLTSLGLLTSHL